MFQTWRSLTFLHWRYDPAVIRRLLPAGLLLDTFDDAAWVGLTPFLLTDLRPPLTPALPWISQFPEMNVRTYVRGPDGKPGVWFFTLEADRLAAVIGARIFYRLPYRWARMRVRDHNGAMEYQSRRKWPFGRGSARITVRPRERIEARQFDNFLTARYRLYSRVGPRIAFADIEHEPWPLERAELLRLEQDVVQHSSVPSPAGDPVLHFSRRLDVRIGRLQVFKSANTMPGSK
jgi:uncharacterized protein